MNHLYYIIITTLFLSIYIYIYASKHENSVDPALYMDSTLTESQKLKIRIHASHHTNEEIKQVVQKLKNGKSWHEAHSVLKPKHPLYHIHHINTEIINLLLGSLTISVGLLFAFTIQTITDIYAPTNNKYMASWYYITTFLITVLTFSVFIMIAKHYLSFRTWKEFEY